MGLIDIVKKAQSFGPLDHPSVSSFALEPFWLTSEPSVKLDNHENDELKESKVSDDTVQLVNRRTVPPVDGSVRLRIEEEERLANALDQKLEGRDVSSVSTLDGLLRTYLARTVAKAEGVNGGGKSGGKAVTIHKLLKKAAPALGRRLLNSILRACVVIGYWDGVQVILDSHLVVGSACPDLVSKLVENNQAFLLGMWIRNVHDPRFSDLLLVLKFFLKSQRPGKSFVAVRQQWRQTALAAIARVAEMGVDKEDANDHNDEDHRGDVSVTENGLPRKRKEAKIVREDVASKAILLGAAVDQFQPHELCLHKLVASGQDEAVLASIVSQLDTNEVLRLLHYLEKWLTKYSTQPIQSNYFKRRKDLWVPSLTQILQWVSVVLDGHYTALVLCSDFHAQLRSIQGLIKGLVDMGYKFSSLVGITEHIRANALLPIQGSSSGDEDHVIEYLEI